MQIVTTDAAASVIENGDTIVIGGCEAGHAVQHDLERDILDRMGFAPRLSLALTLMDARLFRPESIRLAFELRGEPRRWTSQRLAALAGRKGQS